MFNPWKIQNNGSLATRKGCSMLKKISYRCCIFWGMKYNFHFLKRRASFFFLPTSCVECKVYVFIKKFFSFPYRNRFLLTILKGLKPFWLQVKTWNWIKELLALEFCRNQNKVISILTETHINHDQIHHIRNNWLGSNFFSLGIVTQKNAFLASSGTWRLTLIQKGGLCPLSLLPLFWKTAKLYGKQGQGKWRQNNTWRL